MSLPVVASIYRNISRPSQTATVVLIGGASGIIVIRFTSNNKLFAMPYKVFETRWELVP